MKHSQVENRSGSKPIAVSVDGEPLGVLLQETGGYRFLAVRLNAFGIDGQVFASVAAAEAAVAKAVRQVERTAGS